MLKLKDKSLKCDKDIINAIRKLSENTLHKISWWKKNILKVFKPVRYPKISINIYTDALLEDWSASVGTYQQVEYASR